MMLETPRCPKCNRHVRETNTGFICGRCKHSWSRTKAIDPNNMKDPRVFNAAMDRFLLESK